MNILILSAGRRNTIIRYFRKSISGKVVAADMSILAPALYDADMYYQIPSISDNRYLDSVLKICKKENIHAILSLIDPEQLFLSEHVEVFQRCGIKVIGSSEKLCEMSQNKMKMYRWLESHFYKCARTYDSVEVFQKDLLLGVIEFPVFVKPLYGSASIHAQVITNEEMLYAAIRKDKDLLIQEYIQGQEIGADVYVDMISGEVVSIFTKKKLLMRAGETDKAVSFRNERLFQLIENFVTEAGYVGELDIDLFEQDGEYFISEVNPRFGGGYPHAYECGCNHMKMIENNVNGLENPKNIGGYTENLCMMKYSDTRIIDLNRK